MCESYLDEQIVCPHCGNVAALGDYDAIGADDDCVFCNQCYGEFVLAEARAATAGGGDDG